MYCIYTVRLYSSFLNGETPSALLGPFTNKIVDVKLQKLDIDKTIYHQILSKKLVRIQVFTGLTLNTELGSLILVSSI